VNNIALLPMIRYLSCLFLFSLYYKNIKIVSFVILLCSLTIRKYEVIYHKKVSNFWLSYKGHMVDA
jgi:hypothetical protein